MKTHSCLVALWCVGAAGLAGAAQPDAGKAAQRCEVAVAETIQTLRGRAAQDVRFVAASRMLKPSGDEELRITGEGSYASHGGSPVPFSYSCAFNTTTEKTSGVMFREQGGARAAAESQRAVDMTHVSPEACETAIAAQLKVKYPRVGRIAFGSDTRSVLPASDVRVDLAGQGAMQRAPGMNAVPFSYRCEIDSRNGRILSVSTSD